MKVLFRFKALCLLVVLLTGSMGCGGGSGSGNAASIPASTHALAVADVQQEIAASGSQWTAGETSVSQLRTDTELLAMCGLRNAGKAPAAATKFGASAVVPLPAKFTWQDKDGANWLTDVQDQGPYGTCVAFATVGSLEARIRIADSAPTKEIGLSEWHMFFLGGGDLKTGWDDDSANDFLKKTGIPDRTVCPYSQAPGQIGRAHV